MGSRKGFSLVFSFSFQRSAQARHTALPAGGAPIETGRPTAPFLTNPPFSPPLAAFPRNRVPPSKAGARLSPRPPPFFSASSPLFFCRGFCRRKTLPQAFSACAAGPSNRRRIYFARFTAARIIAAAENHTKKRHAACQKSLFNRQEWHLRFYLKQPCRAPKNACRAAKYENLTIFFHAPARTAMPGLKVHRSAVP